MRTPWFAHALVDTLFPHECAATGVMLEREDRGLSEKTRLEIAHAVNWPYCTRCGATSGLFTDHRRYRPCPRCPQRNLGVDSVVRVGTFDGTLARLVSQLKFGRQWHLARVLAPFLFQAVTRYQAAHEVPCDVLVPVPLHWRRRWSRGFNQSDELARELGRLLGRPVSVALWRRRSTQQQSATDSLARRMENLKDAFGCAAGSDFAGKHVWLIDDVCTTGATLHAAARALKELPAERKPVSIRAAVVCVTDRNAVPEMQANPHATSGQK